MKHFLSLMVLMASSSLLFAQAFLSSPIAGQEIDTFTIVNYVDWDFVNSYDHMCGSKTYDGHQGTDFSLKSFVDMDAGIDVLAAADGEITFVIDSLFDRETVSDVSKGLGNFIAIRHANDYYTYYGHLKKNSALVNVGQMVQAGDAIAQVGSSGNSTDPHLHFELWFDSLQVVDPFQGTCGNPQSLWLEAFTYETTFSVWDSGLADYLPSIDQLRERENLQDCCPYTLEQTQTQPTTYWAQMKGLRAGDHLTIQWYTPEDQLWFEFDFDLEQDWWYYYYWTYIDPGMLMEGTWDVVLSRNEEEVDRIEFIVGQPTSVANPVSERCQNIAVGDILRVEKFDFMGRPISLHQSSFEKQPRPIIERTFLKNGDVCVKKLF